MIVKCKKEIYYPYPFKKGEWYIVEPSPANNFNRTYKVHYNDISYTFMSSDEFKERFISVQKHREIEINKILDQ